MGVDDRWDNPPPVDAGGGRPAGPDPGTLAPPDPLTSYPRPAYPSAGDWIARLAIPTEATKGWLKFMGIVSIAAGILTALTLIGILWAWLYIWLGALLWQAGVRAEQAAARRDPFMLEQYLVKLKTVITISGVVIAVGVVLSVFALFVVLAVGWVGLMAGLRNAFPL